MDREEIREVSEMLKTRAGCGQVCRRQRGMWLQPLGEDTCRGGEGAWWRRVEGTSMQDSGYLPEWRKERGRQEGKTTGGFCL